MDTLYYYLRIRDYNSPFQILVVGITNDYELLVRVSLFSKTNQPTNQPTGQDTEFKMVLGQTINIVKAC